MALLLHNSNTEQSVFPSHVKPDDKLGINLCVCRVLKDKLENPFRSNTEKLQIQKLSLATNDSDQCPQLEPLLKNSFGDYGYRV